MKLKDRLFSSGFILISVLLSAFLCLISVYSEESYTGLAYKPILEYMLTQKSDIFLEASSLYAAPLVACSQWNNWFPLFLPLLCTLPFIGRLSAEMKGNYRFRAVREGSFSAYYRKSFFFAGLSGAGSAAAGFGLFSALVFLYYPHNSGYAIDAKNPHLQRKPLNSPLNEIFGTQSELVYWLNTALVVFVYAFLISSVCFMFYIILMNKYKTLGLPIIVSFLSERAVADLWLGGKTKALIFAPRYLLFWTKISLDEWGISYPMFFALTGAVIIMIYFAAKPVFRKRVMN